MASQSLNLSGAPDASIFNDAAVQKRFEPLVDPLKGILASHSTAPLATGKTELDAPSLAQLTCDIQLFQHRHLSSKSSDNIAKPVRIPAHCFQFATDLTRFDEPLTTNAPVYHLLSFTLQYLAAHGKGSWSDISSDSPDHVSFFTQLIAEVRKKLKEESIIKPVKVAAGADVSLAEKESCKGIAHKLECEYSIMYTHFLIC